MVLTEYVWRWEDGEITVLDSLKLDLKERAEVTHSNQRSWMSFACSQKDGLRAGSIKSHRKIIFLFGVRV